MYTLETVEEIVETFVKEDAPQWVKDYVRNFIKNYYFVEEEKEHKIWYVNTMKHLQQTK